MADAQLPLDLDVTLIKAADLGAGLEKLDEDYGLKEVGVRMVECHIRLKQVYFYVIIHYKIE